MKIKLPLLIGWEYLKRGKIWIIIGVILSLALILTQIKFHLFYSQNTLRIGLVGTYQEHDIPLEVTKLLSVGLVKTGQDNRIRPNLIQGWDVNHDATEFKFKLQDNLKWSDNTVIKSQDMEFGIPNTTVTYPNDKTIQFNLKEPYSPLPALLIKPVFKKGTLIGTGPYRITRIEKSRIFITKVILESSNPKLPPVQFRFYPNEKTAITGFNLGEVQVLMGVTNLNAFNPNALIQTKTQVDYSKIVTVLFQTADQLLGNRSLRQALAYQIPKITGEETANNPYPQTSWAYNNDAKKYLSNQQEAKSALTRAKSALSDDKLQSELILTSTPNLAEVGKNVVDAWKALGFNSKLRIESGIPQNFQALLITQSIPVDPDQYFLWHATQTKTNLTKYDSKRVDKDLEDGRKIVAEEDRKAKYFDFQKSLLEDAPAVFLYFPKYNMVYLKKTESLLDQVLNISKK